MNLYDLFMHPLEQKGLVKLRTAFVSQAEGKVLEIGAGTGVNMTYYLADRVALTLTDHKVNPILEDKLSKTQLSYRLVESNVESLEFEDASFDTIVFTLVFCTVKDVQKGLKELYRVLKPGGKLIFIEHVLPIEQPTRTFFNIATPLWKKMASGCHLNRDFLKSLHQTDFHLQERRFVFGTKFVGGIAIKEEEVMA